MRQPMARTDVMPTCRIARAARAALLAGGLFAPAAATLVPAPAGAQTPVQPSETPLFEPSVTGTPTTGTPVLFSADEIHYDEPLGTVVASGAVEIVQGERVLSADRVTYNQKSGKVTASGNVVLLQPSGEVIFSSYAELTEELRDGVIRDLRMRLSDDSRVTASDAVRKAGDETVMRNGLFTPCKACEDNPASEPFWQIKAERVVHDEQNQDIEYYNAFVELFGVPVLYAPYFTHPDPTVKRRSGFLVPTVGSSNELGFLFRIPYYYVISQDFDLTVEPIFLTQQGVIGAGEIRKRFRWGSFRIGGSYGVLDRVRDDGTIAKNSNRGHIRIEGQADLSDNWRARGQIFKTTDDTYLRRFNFSGENVLESKLVVEGFHDNNYTSIEAFDFQGLRQEDVREETPIILPRIGHQYIYRPDGIGGELAVDSSLLVLGRDDGPSSRRLSVGGSWRRQAVVGNGQIIDLTLGVRGDAYHVDAVPQSADDGPGAPTFSGVTGRLMPQAALEWRYPLMRQDGSVSTYIEPRVGIVAAPNGFNPEEIPNEDSRSFKLDDTNLFERNRFSGIDRADGGQRVTYGMTAGSVGESFSVEAFIGQSYQLRKDSTFDVGSGADALLSDVVGRLDLEVEDYADVLYRFRFDNKTLAPQRHELEFRFGVPEFSVTGNYLFIDQSTLLDQSNHQEEITLGLNSQFSENWSANFGIRRDLSESATRLVRAGLSYSNDCIRIDASLTRTFFNDREIQPDDSIFLRVTLKHLGEFGGSL